jgi:hypothetical protein
VELGKELRIAQARFDVAKSMDPPKDYTFHHAIQNAMNSLALVDKPIRTPSDLDGVKGFGDAMKSLAKTLMQRILGNDASFVRPKRLRNKHAQPYAPKYGSQSFAVLCIMRRHDAAIIADFAKWNTCFQYSNTPFAPGAKGWSGQPMSTLIKAGLVLGSPETGWQLTPDGIDAADEALRKFDAKESNAGKRRRLSTSSGSMSSPHPGSSAVASSSTSKPQTDDWEADELEIADTKEEKKTSSRSRRLSSFWDDDDDVPSAPGLGLSTPTRSGPSPAPPSSAPASSSPPAAAAAPGSPAASAQSVAAQSTTPNSA